MTTLNLQPSRQTETRHHPQGKTCHHFVHHRITCDEYDALQTRAAGRCELCGVAQEESGGGRLVVDHFQSPGVRFVRGLICDRCNSTMACLDEKKPWGPKRVWEEAALAYEARSWHQPTKEQRALAQAARQHRREHREGIARMCGRRRAA